MMRRRRQARFPPASGAAGSDTDALQTDVMRFMSIIGLCLMAVFALVQSIPVQEPVKPAQAAQATRLRQEIRAQQQQVRELQSELRALQSEMNSTQQQLTAAQHQLVELAGKTQQAREQRDRLQTQAGYLGQQLEKERLALTDLERASEQEQHNLNELRQRLLKSQVQLDHSRKEIETLKRRSRQQAARPVIEKQSPPDPATTPAPIPAPTPGKQGFSLRFASDAALDRLVAAGSVTLYGMASQQAWRLSMQAGRPVVAQAPFPGWFHEMSAATVPSHYLNSLEKTAHGPGQSSVVWGVQLPAATRADIASLTRGQQGGALVIRGDGQVIQEE